MDYSIFETSFQLFKYRRKVDLFYKSKSSSLIIFRFEEISHDTEIRLLFTVIPFLSEIKVDLDQLDWQEVSFINDFTNCLLQNSYRIKHISRGNFDKIIKGLNMVLSKRILPACERYTVLDFVKLEGGVEEYAVSKFSKKELRDISNQEDLVFRITLFLIKYYDDFFTALQWMDILKKYKHTSLNIKEEELLRAINTKNIEKISNLIKCTEENFVRNNCKDFVL